MLHILATGLYLFGLAYCASYAARSAWIAATDLVCDCHETPTLRERAAWAWWRLAVGLAGTGLYAWLLAR